MIESKLPKCINVERLCRQNENLSGRLLITDLPRLKSMQIELTEQPIDIILEFRHEENQQAIIKGTIKAILNLRCQRCLGAFLYAINSDFQWGIVKDDKQAKQIQHHYDPIIVSADGSIELIKLLEDEIILNVPIIPMHQNVLDCGKIPPNFIQPTQTSLEKERHSPFSKLTELKKNINKTK